MRVGYSNCKVGPLTVALVGRGSGILAAMSFIAVLPSGALGRNHPPRCHCPCLQPRSDFSNGLPCKFTIPEDFGNSLLGKAELHFRHGPCPMAYTTLART